MRLRLPLVALTLVTAAACADFFAPPLGRAFLHIVPVFSTTEALAAGEADSLRIVVERDSSGTFAAVVDTIVGIDPDSGTAEANISVLLLTSPQSFIVRLMAYNSVSGDTLYSGVDTLSVAASTGGEPTGVEIPVSVLPLGAASVEIAPSDTAVQAGQGFTFRATVFDSAGAAIDVPVRFRSSDTTVLQVNRLTGAVTTSTGADAVVQVIVNTVDGAAFDTARVAVGRVPALVVLAPGYLNLATGGSATLEDSVFDAQRNFLGLDVDWASRNSGVAAVSSAGVVTAVAPGTVVIAGTTVGAGTVGDSVLVTVPADGNVVARTLPGNRSYERASVGDTVVVDVMVDMQFAAPEVLGSYNASMTWDPAVLTYVDVQTADFAAPTVNDNNAATGELRFGSADATGVGGQVVVSRVRFVAAAQGTTAATLSISEMSAAQTFTNLISRVTVTSGFVTVGQ